MKRARIVIQATIGGAGKIDAGDIVLCAAFGSGLVWGAGLIRW